MALIHLPTELKVQIAEHLEPFGCFDFALTCKENWNVCSSTVKKHKIGFLEYRSFDASLRDADITKTLREVLEDPHKCWYLSELSLPRDWLDEDQEIGEEDQEIFKEVASELSTLYPPLSIDSDEGELTEMALREYYTPDVAKDLEEGILRGKRGALVAILVHHLPYLKTIRMTFPQDGCRFTSLLRRVAFEYHHDFLDKKRLPFQRLSTVAVAHYDIEGKSEAGWALTFLRMPSLKTFAAQQMGGAIYYEDDDEEEEADDGQYRKKSSAPLSNVTEIFLNNCQFQISALDKILASTKALKKFTYDGGGAIISETNYDAKRVINLLKTHAHHSLEQLVLRYHEEEEEDNPDDEDRPKEVSLLKFERMKHLSCSWKMLWPVEEDDDLGEPLDQGFYKDNDLFELDIRTVLPQSLEELYLEGTFDNAEWACLTEPFNTANSATPNLRTVRIERYGGGREPTDVFGVAQPQGDLWKLMYLFQGHGW